MYKPADYFSDSEEEYDEYDNDGFDFFSPNVKFYGFLKIFLFFKKHKFVSG